MKESDEEKKTPTRRVGQLAARVVTALALITLLVCVSSCGYTRYNYTNMNEQPEGNAAWNLHLGFNILDAYRLSEDEHGNYVKPVGGDTVFYYLMTTCQIDTVDCPVLDFVLVDPTLYLGHDPTGIALEVDSSYSFRDRGCAYRNVNLFGPFAVPIPRPDTIVVRQHVKILNHATGDVVADFPYESIGVLRASKRSHIYDFLNGN